MEEDIFSDLIGQAGFKPLTKQAPAQLQPKTSAEHTTVAVPAKAQTTGHVGPREPVLPEPDLLDTALTGSEANGTSQTPQLGINLSKEELQTMVQQVVETALDSTMSKFIRSLRTVLEDMGRRIEATGSACLELRDSVEQFKDQLESQGSSMHSRFTNVDLAVKEVERGVQSLRDKQELLEAQAMLAKLSTKPAADSSAETAQKQPETPAAAAAATTPAAASAPVAPAPPAAAAAAAPAAVAATLPAASQPSVSSYAPAAPQAPAGAAPPPPAPAAPPAMAPGVPPAPAAPYAPVAPPPGAPPPQQQQPQQQFAPPPPVPYSSQGMSAPPAPSLQPVAPPPMYQQQPHAPPQQPGGSYMSGPPSYSQGPPPAAMYGPPPGAGGPQYPAPPAGAYPAPFRTGSGQLPHQGGPVPGGRPGPQQQQGGPAIQQLSLDKVVNDIVAMGFSHGQVMNVIRQLQSSGQPLEMNVIIDRCMR